MLFEDVTIGTSAQTEKVRSTAVDRCQSMEAAEALLGLSAGNNKTKTSAKNEVNAKRCKRNRERRAKEIKQLVHDHQAFQNHFVQQQLELQEKECQIQGLQKELFDVRGYTIIPPPADKSKINSLKEAIHGSPKMTSTTITGDYSQAHLGDVSLLSQTAMMSDVLQVAKRIFCQYLGKEVEVDIYQAAILTSQRAPIQNFRKFTLIILDLFH